MLFTYLAFGLYIVYDNTHNKGRELERNSRKLIRMLENDGWRPVNQKGSHIQFKHPSKPGRVTVPHPNRDLPAGTVASIYKQAGLK